MTKLESHLNAIEAAHAHAVADAERRLHDEIRHLPGAVEAFRAYALAQSRRAVERERAYTEHIVYMACTL